MRVIEAQRSDPIDHLALDEAMLRHAEEESFGESIRLWEFSDTVVVAGRATRIAKEVHREYCESAGIPILRRCSGGAAIVGGPGCLMYSVVLSTEQRPQLTRIDAAHQYVMGRVVEAVQRQVPGVRLQGVCDLTWNDRKFSGNALKIARRHLLYHGTLLYGFDLPMIESCLRQPPRQPEYRADREHLGFVTNLPLDDGRLSGDLLTSFGASVSVDARVLEDRIRQLRRSRYDAAEWHFRH